MPQIQDIFHQVLKRSDGDGNIYEMTLHPAGLSKVYLRLKGENKDRMIGEIDVQRRTIRVKRVKARHWFRSDLGYGFNWVLINEELPVQIDNILLIEDDYGEMDYFLIPLKKIRELGHKLKHISAGIELQWFMKMSDMLQFRLKDKKIISEVLSPKYEKI